MIRLVLIASSAALLAGCPHPELNCNAPTVACPSATAENAACVDTSVDSQNCGGCGISCGPGGACNAGVCACAPGAVQCGAECAFVAEDPDHCGSCEVACAANQVCEGGACKAACTVAGATDCARSCVELQSSETNCGSCGTYCDNATSCHAGACKYDVVAACSTNGTLVGLQAGTDRLGPSKDIGPNRPLSALPFGEVLMVTDFDGVMNQATQDTLEQVGDTSTVGGDARFLYSEPPFLYVVNSITGTLQIFESTGALDGGYALALRSELPLGTDQGNTYGQGIAKDGNALYIPLQGGFGPAASEGQKVAVVDVTDKSSPVLLAPFDLSGVDLQSFDGGQNLPRPADAVMHRGALYVALTNLDPDYAVNGPGMLAKIDVVTKDITTINLGADRCLQATELVSDGNRLYVACFGRLQYSWDPPYPIVSADQAALLVLDQTDTVIAQWTPACSQGATDCMVPAPSRFAVVGNSVYLGDQNAGRMFVLELRGNQLVERRGYTVDAGPLEACPVGQSGVSNVIDVQAVP